MKVAYFDCFSGASGDMILGALMDAGLKLERLRAEIDKLHLSHFDLQAEEAVKVGIGGTRALVLVDEGHHHHHHRHLGHIAEILDASDLDQAVKDQSLRIFTRLAEAEALVHRTTIENVHFHEVGAMDSIIDVVGSVAGLAALDVEQVFCSPIHVGSGTIKCAHGILPVPAPATAELVKEKPIYSTGVKGELLTPTGAAILTTLASGFGPMPAMTPEKIGYGAGTAELSIPNMLRVTLGEVYEVPDKIHTDRVAVAETNIDDMNPQIYDYLIEKMLAMGALDVFLTPIQMKKTRPGTLLSVICRVNDLQTFAEFLIKETTTIGIRWRIEDRIKAARNITEVETKYGTLKCKVARLGDRIVNAVPEYEDCKQVAVEQGIPLKEVMEAARRAASDGE